MKDLNERLFIAIYGNEPSYFGSDTAVEQMQNWYHENATSPIDYFKICIQSLTPEQFLEFKKELHEIHDNSETPLTDIFDF